MLMERFAEAETDGREHPYFGRMSRWEWGRWTYLAMEHHLRLWNTTSGSSARKRHGGPQLSSEMFAEECFHG
jgi:hypothetical protein